MLGLPLSLGQNGRPSVFITLDNVYGDYEMKHLRWQRLQGFQKGTATGMKGK